MYKVKSETVAGNFTKETNGQACKTLGFTIPQGSQTDFISEVGRGFSLKIIDRINPDQSLYIEKPSQEDTRNILSPMLDEQLKEQLNKFFHQNLRKEVPNAVFGFFTHTLDQAEVNTMKLFVQLEDRENLGEIIVEKKKDENDTEKTSLRVNVTIPDGIHLYNMINPEQRFSIPGEIICKYEFILNEGFVAAQYVTTNNAAMADFLKKGDVFKKTIDYVNALYKDISNSRTEKAPEALNRFLEAQEAQEAQEARAKERAIIVHLNQQRQDFASKGELANAQTLSLNVEAAQALINQAIVKVIGKTVIPAFSEEGGLTKSQKCSGDLFKLYQCKNALECLEGTSSDGVAKMTTLAYVNHLVDSMSFHSKLREPLSNQLRSRPADLGKDYQMPEYLVTNIKAGEAAMNKTQVAAKSNPVAVVWNFLIGNPFRQLMGWNTKGAGVEKTVSAYEMRSKNLKRAEEHKQPAPSVSESLSHAAIGDKLGHTEATHSSVRATTSEDGFENDGDNSDNSATAVVVVEAARSSSTKYAYNPNPDDATYQTLSVRVRAH